MTDRNLTRSALEAENKRLRDYIASCKEVAQAGYFVDLQDRYDALRKACTEMIADLHEGSTIHTGTCPWCRESWPHPRDATPEARVAVYAEHDRRCEKNPLVAEVSALRRAVIDLHHLQLQRHRDERAAWAIREAANDLSVPFSSEAVQARLDEMRKESEP